MRNERVTVTLPVDVVQDIARREHNRSKFVLEAVQRELARRRRDELRRSLQNPHLEAEALAELGLHDWAAQLPAGDADLVEVGLGKRVRWVPGEGWTEE